MKVEAVGDIKTLMQELPTYLCASSEGPWKGLLTLIRWSSGPNPQDSGPGISSVPSRPGSLSPDLRTAVQTWRRSPRIAGC